MLVPGRLLLAAGFENIQRISKGDRWQIWDGDYESPARTTTERIVFFTRTADIADLNQATSWLASNGYGLGVTAIFANDALLIEKGKEKALSVLGTNFTKVIREKEFLFSVLYRFLGQSQPLPDDAHPGLKYFIDPLVTLEGAASATASELLRDWAVGNKSLNSNVAVLRGPAGTGKTTLARKVFSLLPGRYQVLPLLIEAQQWVALHGRRSLELADVLQEAVLRWYKSAILGPNQVETGLATGSICLLFDGFDELFSYFPDDFDPTETLHQVLGLAGEGHILLTTRNQFWWENVDVGVRRKVVEIDLESFTPALRDRYVEKRFARSPEKADRARRVLDRVAQATTLRADREDASPEKMSLKAASILDPQKQRLDTIPFVVFLACESSDSDDSELLARYGQLLDSDDPLEGLVLAFCDRERKRQRIGLASDYQLKIFERLAAEFNGAFGIDDIKLVLSYFPGSHAQEDPSRLCHHALLERSRIREETRAFGFRFSVLEDYFIGRVVLEWLRSEGQSEGGIQALRCCAEREASLVEDVASLIFRCLGLQWLELAASCYRSARLDEREQASLFALVNHLARMQANRIASEATTYVLQVMGSVGERSLDLRYLRGRIVGLDFCGLNFQQTTFEDVTWTRCIFDEATRFLECRFAGTFAHRNCEGLALAKLINCWRSKAAEAVLGELVIDTGARVATRDDVVSGVEEVLGRFRRSHGFRKRRVDAVQASVGRVVPFGKKMFSVLERCQVLTRFKQSGVEKYQVADTTGATILLEQGAVTGRVHTAVEKLASKVVGRQLRSFTR